MIFVFLGCFLDFLILYFHYNYSRGERAAVMQLLLNVQCTLVCAHCCFFFQIFGFLSKRFQYWLKKESIRYRTFTSILSKRVYVFVIVRERVLHFFFFCFRGKQFYESQIRDLNFSILKFDYIIALKWLFNQKISENWI